MFKQFPGKRSLEMGHLKVGSSEFCDLITELLLSIGNLVGWVFFFPVRKEHFEILTRTEVGLLKAELST